MSREEERALRRVLRVMITKPADSPEYHAAAQWFHTLVTPTLILSLLDKVKSRP